MSAVPAQEREEVRRLVELVPDADLPTVRRMLAGLTGSADPVLAAFEQAPEVDEEVTDEDLAAIEAGRQAKRESRVVSHEEALRRLGL